ncbi:MAG: hypothetical protein LBV71_06330, partial [Prevotella sp.]|nr:hypothetical protein [Prevotella sp.]
LLVRIVCGCCADPSLKKPKFKRYLEEYARDGLACRRPKRMTPERKVYYEAIRKKKMEKYMAGKKELLENL